MTGGGELPARWVIHAVGPVWRGGDLGEEDLLASAVRSALERAEEIGAKSVALPAISTGVYGFPLRRAAEISVAEARRFSSSARSVERIVFCLFDDSALAAFEKAGESVAFPSLSSRRHDRCTRLSLLDVFRSIRFLCERPFAGGRFPAGGGKEPGTGRARGGRPGEAKRRFEAVRKLAPGEPLGWANGAIAAMRAKDLAEAKKLLSEASRLAGATPGCRARRDAARAGGDSAGAIEAFEKAAAANPKDLPSRWSAARLAAASPGGRQRSIRNVEARSGAVAGESLSPGAPLRAAAGGGQPAGGSVGMRPHGPRDRIRRREAREVRWARRRRLSNRETRRRRHSSTGSSRTSCARPPVISRPGATWSRESSACRWRSGPRARGEPARAAARRSRFASPRRRFRGCRRSGPDRRARGREGRPRSRLRRPEGARRRLRSRRISRGNARARLRIAAAVEVADVMNSGDLDLVTPGALWIREKETWRKTEIASGDRVLPVDYDSDGDLDLYVSSGSGDRLLRNNLDGTWTDATQVRPAGGVLVAIRGGGGLRPRRRSRTSCSFRAAAGSSLLDNLRGGRFAEKPAGLPRSRQLPLRGGRRPERRRPAGPRLDDGEPRVRGVEPRRRDVPAGRSSWPREECLSSSISTTTDTWTSSSRGPNGSALFRNDGAGAFTRVEGTFPAALDAEAVDFDGDGDLDLVLVTAGGGAALLENQGGNANGWLDVALEGLPTGSAKVNRFGYGSEWRSSPGLSTHADRLAAGDASGPRRATARRRSCASSGPTAFRRICSRRRCKTLVKEVQQLKGSCPFLYAFDGSPGAS